MGTREEMICPSEEELTLHIDEALDAEAAARIDAHLEACVDCRELNATLRAIDDAVATPEPGADRVLDRVLAIPDQVGAPGVGRRRWAVVALASAAALLLALAVRGWVASSTVEERHRAAVPPVRPETQPSEERAPAVTEVPRSTVEVASLGEEELVLLHNLARGKDEVRARAAIRRLGELGRRESLPVLRDGLGMSDRRIEAVRALGLLGDERTVDLLAPLLTDAEASPFAFDALVRIGGRRAARALDRAIDAAPDPETRQAWIDALGTVDGLAGARALARRLDARDAETATAARAALHRHEVALLPHLLTDARSPRGAEAEPALAALEMLAPPAAVPTCARLLKARTHRARAAQILARIDTPEAARALWDGLPDPEVRASFRRGGLGIEAWLLERLLGGDRRVQLRVIDLLGLCGSPRSVPALAALADDPALAPRVIAALGRIGGEPAVASLVRLAERPPLKRPAVAALGLTGSVAAVGELQRLGASDRSLRDPAILALASIPSPEAVEAIVRLDDGSRSRRSTERALRAMDRKVVLTTLHELLEGELADGARRALAAVGSSAPGGAGRVVLQ